MRSASAVAGTFGGGSKGLHRLSLVLGTLIAGMALVTPANAASGFAHPSAPPLCTNGYNAYVQAPKPPSPTASITVFGTKVRTEADPDTQAPTLVAETGLEPANRRDPTPQAVNARGSAPFVAPGRRIVNYCRWFDDPFKPRGNPEGRGSTEHFDAGTTALPGFSNPNQTTSTIDHYYSQPCTNPSGAACKYELWLHAIDDQEAWSSRVSQPLHVNGVPSASFAPPPRPLAGQPVTLTSTSSDHPIDNRFCPNNNCPLEHRWDLNGGTNFSGTGTRTQVTKTWPAGTREAFVNLQVTDRWNTKVTTGPIKIVFDNATPIPSFTSSPSNPTAGQAVMFTSTSSDPDGQITDTQWDLDGDGAYDDASGPSASYVFPRDGLFPVGVRVTDNRTATATTRRTIVVGPSTASPSSAAGANAAAAPGSGTTTRRLLSARVRISALLTRRGVRMRTLGVTTARGATVRVRCVGRDCKPRAQTLRSRGRLLRLKRFQRSYRAGTVLHVYVTQRGSIGRYVRIKIRKRKAPLRTDLCLKPGARRPTRC